MRILLLNSLSTIFNIKSAIKSAKSFNYDKIIYLKHEQGILYHDANIENYLNSLEIKNFEIVKNLENLVEYKNYAFIAFYPPDYKDSFNIESFELKNDNFILILGNEVNGITDNIKHLVTDKVFIPQKSSFDSYNVSVAATIGMYIFDQKIKKF